MLIEGVLFRAKYLGSTQLVCEGQPTKTTRMMQAEEAVSRIKVSIYLIILTFLFCNSNFIKFAYGIGFGEYLFVKFLFVNLHTSDTKYLY